MDCTEITDDAVSSIATHCALATDVNLSGCPNISDSGIGSLSSHLQLHTLRIARCKGLTDYALKLIATKCTALARLDCSHGNFTGKHVAHLAALKGAPLVELKLAGAPIPADVFIQTFFSLNLTQLEELDISDTHHLTDSCLAALVGSCTGSSSSSVAGAEASSATSSAASSASSTPREMSVHHLSDSSDDAASTASGSPTSTHGDLPQLHQQQQHRQHTFQPQTPQLRYLNVSSSAHITDDGIQHISSTISQLSEIHLARCPQLSSRTLVILGTYYTKVQQLPFSLLIYLN